MSIYTVPNQCLHDEPIEIIAEGLKPHENVTISSHVTDAAEKKFFAYAHYRANEDGYLNLANSEALGGHFLGLFPMGLLACLKPEPIHPGHLRFLKRDVEKPSVVEFRLYRGHITPDIIFASELRPFVPFKHLRHYMAPGVQRIPVHEGRLRGALFIPAGRGPFPAVIDMFGTAGGLLDFRSAQLASRGIMSLALAYFGYEDLPQTLVELDLAYFREAADFLIRHPKVLQPSIGVIGVSKGADLALSMAVHIPFVRAAVSISGNISNTTYPLVLEDFVFPALQSDANKCWVRDGKIDMENIMQDPEDYPDTIIPIEKADASFLFLVGDDDHSWKSKRFAAVAKQRMDSAGKTNIEVKVYEGAGHLIEPPYSSFCHSSYHKFVGMPLIWGGNAYDHTNCQVQAWTDLLVFLRQTLLPASEYVRSFQAKL